MRVAALVFLVACGSAAADGARRRSAPTTSAMTATPSDGFTVIDSVLAPAALVPQAGTYDVTWTASRHGRCTAL